MGDRSQRHGVFHRRLRQSERASRSLRVALLLAGLLLPKLTYAGPQFVWSVDLGAGYDDQILADPLQIGVVSPVADEFFSGSSHFLMRLADYKSDHRFDVLANVGGVVYGERVEGGDTEISAALAYRRRILPPLALDVSGSGAWFRRDEQAGGAPVFDQDLYTTDARLSWALGKKWLATAGGRYDWARYPGRKYAPTSDPQTFDAEEQKQWGAVLAAGRRLGTRGRLNLELQFRHLDSNIASSEYHGPTALVRGRFHLPLELTVTPVIAYTHRSFDSYQADTLGLDTRWDDSWQYGINLGRPVSSRLSLFVDGSFLHQLSNVSDFQFDEARVSAGFAFQIVSSIQSAPVLNPPPTRKLAPDIHPDGVRFRFRAPEARSVSVVGDWNGWSKDRNPLRGPFKGGVWEATVPLKPGIWRYAFVVDGVWQPPPDAPRTEGDGFGGIRGVLDVGEDTKE
jgi:AMP-activated protein kinase-like protein